ncbi:MULTISPECIES: glycosyltransferase family 2 protein [Planktothricoides]|uniref:Glycosyltransferase family 2 protein n=2 Tax=Planktothricoides raciborskii TaxID=132608 RepID=A0AAU8JKV3_9CYAN|nr:MULTISPECIES: glycosyltransferase family 2 protein [Planktothricoides]KOR34731.1 glycosyl transferase [Planktothricoides sp. SR001]MBD2546703.1 glycosyltransferase family 2 protein [Planktothricoides raciborskii FACHB-1370]MBD2582647.1 glycosyltransferase family 2 protein [Planktothricoides raciborskii FACHB-1261]
MTKLIIQIPCYNEEATLGITLSELPRQLPGVDCVEWLVVDDGSRDRTVEVAKACGVDYIVNLPTNQGLAKAFMAGLEGALKAGADIIVNTDADNQYCAEDIPKLIQPILLKESEIVIGARPILDIEHFSPTKKLLQKLGSWVVRLASQTDIPDAPSGFRAFSREAAMQLNVFNEYTYTLETIIQAGQKGMAITSVPIRTNGYLRPSRLVKSIPVYIKRSIFTIFRIFMTYKPLRFFLLLGGVPFTIGFGLGFRWLIYFLIGTERTRIPSLILAAILMLMGFQLWILGLVADLLAVNRKLLEEIQLRMRRAEIETSQLKPLNDGAKKPGND